MRKLLFIAAILFSVSAFSQTTHTVAFGSNGYVTIDGQNYKRGDLVSHYTYNAHDSTLAILYSYNMLPLIKSTIDSNYLYADTANKKAYSMPVLRTWFNANFEYRGN